MTNKPNLTRKSQVSKKTFRARGNPKSWKSPGQLSPEPSNGRGRVKMKIKLGELKNIIEGMQDIANKDMPATFSYWITKTIPVLIKEHQDVEKSRNDLCMKYCKKDDEGNPVTKKDEHENDVYDIENMDEFNEELVELMNVEIEIKFTPILIDRLENIDISPVTLIKLNKFILDEPDAN